MKILVLNSGSSSLKSQLFIDQKLVFKGLVDGIGLDTCKVVFTEFISDESGNKTEDDICAKDHEEAIDIILSNLISSKVISDYSEIDAIGHRVVHGGEEYSESVSIDDNVIKCIDKLSCFAPLHNPPNLQGILACKKKLEGKPQVAVFDTSFHSTIPKNNYMYAIPKKYYKDNGIRKYGFHGTSFRYIASAVKEKLGTTSRLIICHIGNGSSICAVKDGKSIDTSMGFTPLQGLVMGTRSGDIDPSVVMELAKIDNSSCDDALKVLNKQSGLKGICGDSDMREIWSRIQADDGTDNSEDAKLALDMLANSIVKYVSYYIAQMGGVDNIVFTAGLGEKAFYLRKKVIDCFDFAGIKLDDEKNEAGEEVISSDDSSTKVMALPTNEELMIAKDTENIIND